MSREDAMRTREERVAGRAARRKAKIEAKRPLRRQSQPLDVAVPSGVSSGNAICPYGSRQEERAARHEASEAQMQTARRVWPVVKKRLLKEADPRNAKKIKHQKAVLLLYGILLFVCQRSSRREANREMTRPQFRENVRLWFPEIDELPHQDTVARLLALSEPEAIEAALVELVGELVRKKKFARYLVENCYPIALDGTGKLKRNDLVCSEWLTRTIHKEDGTQEQHHVYVLEVSLAFRNGMTIPLLSEFLTYDGGSDETKQDCEQRAFHRVVERLKTHFPRLPMLLLLDGLYANGPVMAACRTNRWQFMIVLQDGSLKSVGEEFKGLSKITTGNRCERIWGGRRQRFTWINHIEYRYDKGEKKRQIVHVVVCDESWQEWDDKAEALVTRTAHHAWLSSEPLSGKNVHERCNHGARHRWGIEESFLVEKHQGYHYEHAFSDDWNAMRGYHYLMRIGHLINILTWYSSALTRDLRRLGIRGFLALVWSTLTAPWLEAEAVRVRLCQPWQLRLL
jgi:hypothetical protein